MKSGAIVSGADEEQLQALEVCRCFGLAFQITDDILDVEGDRITGKNQAAMLPVTKQPMCLFWSVQAIKWQRVH